MERAKLIVKNFGPLKDIEIEVREMVTFIGAQASGKSTLAKLLSIFEDENFRKGDKISFEDELKKYNIFSYLKDDSVIKYQSSSKTTFDPFSFEYSEKKFKKRNSHFSLELLKSINWEKASLEQKDSILQSLKRVITANTNFFKLHFKENFIKLFKDEIQTKKFHDFLKTKGKSEFTIKDIEKIALTIGYSDSVMDYSLFYEKMIYCFPNLFFSDSLYIPSERSFIHLISENTLGLINNNIQIPKHLLNTGQDYEKAIQAIKELPLAIIDKKITYKREGKTSYIYYNETEKTNLLESASGLQTIVPILLLVEYAKSLKDKYNFNFVVEEPELNLYPKAQHELIKYLVKNCMLEMKNLIITTHSPFVLASINNLLLAYDKGQTKSKEVNKIIKKESWLNPKNFIAYQLKNGRAYMIMDDKLGQIKENMIDIMSDEFSIEFDKLLDL